MQQVPKITNIPINALGGAETLIAGTTLSSKVEIMEDPSYNAGALQGLSGYYMDPDSDQAAPALDPSAPGKQVWLGVATGGRGRAFQPIIFGGEDARVSGGQGLYAAAQGTPLLRLTTNSVNPGGVLLVEWP